MADSIHGPSIEGRPAYSPPEDKGNIRGAARQPAGGSPCNNGTNGEAASGGGARPGVAQ